MKVKLLQPFRGGASGMDIAVPIGAVGDLVTVATGFGDDENIPHFVISILGYEVRPRNDTVPRNPLLVTTWMPLYDVEAVGRWL